MNLIEMDKYGFEVLSEVFLVSKGTIIYKVFWFRMLQMFTVTPLCQIDNLTLCQVL